MEGMFGSVGFEVRNTSLSRMRVFASSERLVRWLRMKPEGMWCFDAVWRISLKRAGGRPLSYRNSVRRHPWLFNNNKILDLNNTLGLPIFDTHVKGSCAIIPASFLYNFVEKLIFYEWKSDYFTTFWVFHHSCFFNLGSIKSIFHQT